MYKDLDKLEPSFRIKVELWLDDNPDIFVTESWRSYSRQLWLYASGRSRDGQIVTWTLKSMHGVGKAVDIAFKGKELYPKDWAKWRTVADSAKKYGIVWLYDLYKVEKVHFQDNGEPLNPFIMKIPLWGQEGADDLQNAGVQTPATSNSSSIPLYQLVLIFKRLFKYWSK